MTSWEEPYMGEESITPPPASKNACMTAAHSFRSSGSSPTLKVIQVPRPRTGRFSPVEGMGLARMRPGPAAPAMGARSTPLAAIMPARRARRLSGKELNIALSSPPSYQAFAFRQRLACRRDPHYTPVVMIGDDNKLTLGALRDVAYAPAELRQQALLVEHVLAFDFQAHERGCRQSADEQVAFPLRESLTAVEKHAGRGDDRGPGINRVLHSGGIFLAGADRRAVIVHSVRHDGPSIVFAGLGNIDLIAALRPMLDFPQLAGFGVKGRGLYVAVAI